MSSSDLEADHYLQPYLDEYYGSLTEENRLIGEFLLAASSRLPDHPTQVALDVGCGPTLLYWGMFMAPCDVHHGLDALDSNLGAVRREIARARQGYQELCDYYGDDGDPGRFLDLCDRVGRLEAVDAAQVWPFEDASTTLVSSVFALEVLPDLEGIGEALAEARRVLVDGGRLVLVSLCETTTWRIGDYVGSCLRLSPPLLEDLLKAAGFGAIEVTSQAAPTATDKEQGYTQILFATAVAGG